MSAVGLTKANAQWAYEHIYNISYQDEGALNGDILSNLLTELSSNHLGHFIPILGKNVGFGEGHYMETLNKAISQYNNIVKKFDNSCRYEDITNMYLSTAIIHGNGYEKVKEEFTKLGVYGANDKIANNSLHLEVITKDTDATSIFSGSNLSTPALYALVNLNPFIVSNINSNAYSEIEKYRDEYSENYVSDKAKMFKALMDTPKVASYYDDYETGKKISYYTSVTDPDSTDEYNLTDTAYTFGTNKNDIVTASVGKANRIYTLAGDDTITLTSGSNYIEAGSGSDYIDLSGIKDTNSTNTIYADLKDSKDDKDSGNDTIIGSAGKDTMYGGSGYNTYKAGDGDTIEDDDKGQGSVYFNSNSPLTGGTYDKDKGCYVGGIYEYHLNGNTLIVTDTAKNESITINNYSKKDKSLGIDLIEADEIDIIISNATVTEGDESEPNKDGKAPYNTSIGIKLSRELKEDEFIIIQKYNYEKQSTELVLFGTLPQDYDTSLFKSLLSDNKTLDFSWYGNKTKEEDRKYCVGGVNIFAKSDNLTIRDIKPGYVTIKDDDKDPNDDKPETYDPLAIDLNNDGIKGTNLDYKINFDLDNNGFKEATSWIDNNDAFITIDKNNNGAIDNGSELFGNKSISNNAYAYTNPNAKNGFEALSEFDSNNDGIIDINDEKFANLNLLVA
ncbi:type I secretion target GGXGXDXXX repeat-containing protein [Campylobacter hominis]|nr:type I secretion target GGXGXDXXX repeat-containing protein [Campylobacter hominis]